MTDADKESDFEVRNTQQLKAMDPTHLMHY